MTTLEIVLATITYTIGSTLQGVLGFGANMFAVPILALINPDFIPGPVLMVNPLMAGIFTWRERGEVNRHDLAWMITGRLPGVAVGVVALQLVSGDQLGMLFGVLLLLAVGRKASGIHAGRNHRTLMAAGSLSGFMGTTVGVGGPPIALLYHDVPGSVLRATMSPYFMIGTTISVTALALTGQFDLGDLVVSAWLVPGVLAGVVVSHRLRGLLDGEWVAPAVYAFSSAAAIVLLIRSLA